MIQEIRRCACALQHLGDDAAKRVMLAAWRKLTLEEQVSVGFAMDMEESASVDWVIEVLRDQLRKELPKAIRRALKGIARELPGGKP